MEGEQNNRGRMLSAISNGILGIHREQYGRGADRARTIMHGDYVACFLEGIFTPVEHTLIKAGKFDQVRETRQSFQDALSDEFRAVVEQHTGRKVAAFFSQIHRDPDMALEGFALEPLPGQQS
jgi:uncharacterized protein YbcI